jgi:hypothetical protein
MVVLAGDEQGYCLSVFAEGRRHLEPIPVITCDYFGTLMRGRTCMLDRQNFAHLQDILRGGP